MVGMKVQGQGGIAKVEKLKGNKKKVLKLKAKQTAKEVRSGEKARNEGGSLGKMQNRNDSSVKRGGKSKGGLEEILFVGR